VEEMKIHPITNPNILKAYVGASQVEAKAKQASKQDEVTFSKEALDFSRAMTQAQESIEARSADERARIETVKTAVAKGEYHVPAEAIADRILESVFRR
jgi:flagellar biosynthesis anti-sigma factor FlgM